MKSSLLAACLICGCLATFRAQATSYEYDWSFSSNPGYTGQIFLDAPSGNGSPADIVSYDIVANGHTFTSANSAISAGSFLTSLIWDTSMIDTMSLQISLTNNPSNIPVLSVTDGTMNGAGALTVGGEWDATTSTSVPDHASTLPLFAFTLVILGLYYTSNQRPQLAVAIKR
jgi:hypothetical protein